jgi:predicted Zn-dependent protease
MGHELAGHFCDGEMSRAEPAGPPAVGEVSPALEAEADRLSLDVLAAAGYDPRAALEVAKLVLPGTKSRSDDGRLPALARALDGRPAGGQRNSEEFKRLKRSLAGPRK